VRSRPGGPAGDNAVAPPRGNPSARPAAGRSSLLSGTTKMVADAPALMDRLHAATGFARRRAVVGLLLALCAALLVGEGIAFGTLADDTSRLYRQPVTLFAVGAALWISLGLHELAHGLVARAYGLRVGEIGLRRRFGLMTYLYCEVEDVQFLPGRGRQIAVAAAGAVANLLFLLPFAVLRMLLPDHAQALPALGGLLLLGTAMALLNLVPLPPLDGYKALGYGLGTLQLASQSRVFTGLTVAAARRDGAKAALRAYPRRLRLVHGGYAALCALMAVAALAVAGLLCRQALPGRYGDYTPYLPEALVAAAMGLRLLGLRAAALRERAALRRGDRAAATPTDAPTPPEHESRPAPEHRPEPRLRPEKGDMKPLHAPAKSAAEPSSGPAVVLDGVTKHYGEVHALDGVSLTVGQGEFFGILGPNGAGKTTLVEIVEGMRKADAGTVSVFGRSPWPRDIALLRRIGVQTQASAFFTRLTAWEHLETVAALHGLDRAAARRALDLVGLGDKERSRVDDLSGGQRQRLALATALVHEPDLIFLDEPTAALDPEARRSLWGVLRELRSEGRTIVYTTHYLDEAEALCDRVAIIAGGRLVALDTPGALIRALAAPARLLVPADLITPDQARAIEGVDRVLVENGEVVIETRAANRVLVAVGAFVDMDAIQTRTATLEDAYLRLTGSEHRP
jgi:ABC-type multidrug transport system ATPase subunit/Zn-dependent protease